MAELGEKATLGIDEQGMLGRPDRDETLPAAKHPRIGPALAAQGIVEPVIAIALLEIGEKAGRIGRLGRGARRRGESEPHEVGARQRARVVDGEPGHGRHAMEFELAISYRRDLRALVQHHRREQIFPVVGDRRSLILAHRGEIFRTRLIVGGGEHGAVGAQPFHAFGTIERRAALAPAGGIGAAETVDDLLRARQMQIARRYFHDEDRDVDVEKEIEVGVDDIDFRRLRLPVEAQARLLHIGAAEDADRRIAIGRAARA